MISVHFDFNDFLRKADGLDAFRDQVPFALSRSLNQAGVDAQTALIVQTWPDSVTVRNPSFLRAALRRINSTKHDLTFQIVDVLHRGSLKLHAVGGTKAARGRFAIPNPTNTPRGSHGVRKPDRPRALIARTPKRKLRITPRGIFTGEHGRLKLRYVLKPSTPQPADVPFYEDFEISMREGVRTAFPYWLRQAMRTRRAR